MRNRIRVASEAGFTIVEMMVGIVVFTIVMGSIYGLLMVARGGRINTNQRAEIMQNARIAINTMSRDAINAGVGYPNFGANIPDNRLAVLGNANDADTNADVVNPVNARNAVMTIDATQPTLPGGVASDQVSFLFIDDTFNGGVSLPIDQARSNGANVRIPTGWTNVNCSAGDIYLISGQSGYALGMMKDGAAASDAQTVQFAAGDALAINNPGATSTIFLLGSGATTPAVAGSTVLVGSLQRVFWVSYFLVRDVGAVAATNTTTTGVLMRRVHGGTSAQGWVDQPLAYGIENMQFQYVLDDGTVLDAPSLAQMNQVRQVRISLAVRSPDMDPSSPRDASGQHQPYRTTLTSTFSTRNTAYEKL